AFPDDRERLRRDGTVGREVVRPLEIDRIDRRVVGESLEVDHARRLDLHLLEVLVADDDVAALLELVAFDEIAVRHLALALRAPALLLDARLTLGVQLIEAERRARVGCREHLDGDVHETDLEISLPRRTGSHRSSPPTGRGQAPWHMSRGLYPTK